VTRISELGTMLVAACVVPSSVIFVTLMEAPGSSETSVLTRATRRNNPEDTILRNIFSFLNVMFSSIKNSGRWTKSRKRRLLGCYAMWLL
jgi:hypothetical protein